MRVFSDQLVFARQTSRLPGSATVVTYNFTVAFKTWAPVVPAGRPERSNFIRAEVEGDATCRDGLVPWTVELPETI